MPKTRAHLWVLALLVSFSAACVSTSVRTVGPFQVKHTPVRRIAVAPFANIRTDPTAGDVVADSVTTELYKRNLIEVIDASRIVGSYYLGAVERSRAQELGQQTGTDAVLYGTVLEYGYVVGAPHMRGTVPTISVNARLVSTSTGHVLWAAGIVSNRLQLWSYDSIPITELAQYVARELVTNLSVHLNTGTGLQTIGKTEGEDAAAPADVQHKTTTEMRDEGEIVPIPIAPSEPTEPAPTTPAPEAAPEPTPESSTPAPTEEPSTP